MPYVVLDDWRAGLDLRRHAAVSSPGSLRELINAHITPGGEVEKRKAFVQLDDLAGSFGLASVNGELIAFSAPGGPGNTTNVAMQTLDPGGGRTVLSLLDYDIYDGKLYVICEDDQGDAQHFFEGVHVASGKGRYLETFGDKVYAVEGKNLHFTAVGDPTSWASGVGFGTINMATQDADSVDLTGLEVYYGQLAIQSALSTQIWTMDADPLANRQSQVLRATGTLAPLATKQYAGGDVLYLDRTGVRSLRARDSSNAASVSDVGSPIDSLLRDALLADPAGFADARSVVEQGTGRFWLSVSGTIYVLSYFPGPKVTAWSTYEPGFSPVDLVPYNQTVAVRGADDRLYVYGGLNYDTYDSSQVTVVTPFLFAEKPATEKVFQALDLAGDGVWQVQVQFDPRGRDTWDDVGVFDGVTYASAAMELSGVSTHAAFRLINSRPGPAVLANLAYHYDLAESS